jgi:catechol 2,3-dioxygenase-like lactoylglutathione lyase family enzyme
MRFARNIALAVALLAAAGAFAARVVAAVSGAPASLVAVADAAQPAASGPALAASVDTVGFTVSDMDRSLAFFEDVLAFEKLSEVEVTGGEYERLQGVFPVRMRVATLRLGGERIELTEYLAPSGRPIPADSRSNDRWFQHVAIIVSDMQKAYTRLRKHRVEHASSGPQRLPDWNPAAGGIEAFYFKDPDGHVLEVLAFPPGKGEARWQRKDALFLGIDHTAIVVDDTERSLVFYRDTLGLRIAGESENYGEEQERLNAVFAARLRITALRAPGGGPGVELLEYLAPSDGRPLPADQRASDIAHWQTTFTSASADSGHAALRNSGAPLVSPGPVQLPDRKLGFVRGLTARDPDGHVLRIVGR